MLNAGGSGKPGGNGKPGGLPNTHRQAWRLA
jgi:hypothetical protein